MWSRHRERPCSRSASRLMTSAARREVAHPLGLYLLALVLRLLVATEIPFPTTEPSAYYVGVAQNLVNGQGLVSDAVGPPPRRPLKYPSRPSSYGFR